MALVILPCVLLAIAVIVVFIAVARFVMEIIVVPRVSITATVVIVSVPPRTERNRRPFLGGVIQRKGTVSVLAVLDALVAAVLVVVVLVVSDDDDVDEY